MKTIFPLIRCCMLLMACSLLWSVTACSDDDPSGSNGNSRTEWSVQKVAVVLPLTSSTLDRTHYERTTAWFLDNFQQAQAGCDQGITLELEWHDEDTEDLSALATELASRPEIVAVVGPQRSSNVDVMASAYSSAEKPMIVPVASSEEIIRKFSCNEFSFSDAPFLWSLTETDISQSEVMLSIVTSTGGKSIALLTPDDVYGKTFAEWVPFLANELGVQLKGQYSFMGSSDFRPAAQLLMASEADFALCICDDDALMAQLLQLRQQAGDSAPRLLFSDGALSSELLKQGTAAEGIEGVAMYADPSSGFQISYEERFQEIPTMSEAQFYDALLLTGFAAFYCQHTDETNLNKAIQTITSQRENHGLNAWDAMGMTQYLTQLEKQHYLIDFRGASGEIKFDAEAYTSVLHSTYVHWVVHDGKLVALDYASSDGNNRTEGTLASWNWRVQSQQEIDDKEADIHYGELHDRWALLVAGSESWNNYRHQADVLNVYQLLKRQGWDDDHIILVMRDDLAYHGSNPYPGEIYASVGGENLYKNVQIDYRADTLATADICSILLGQRSSHLPVVVESDAHSNLLFYWSGHGYPGYFSWLDIADHFTTDMLSQTLTTMQAESRYRKFLICTESCFSSSVVKAAQGIPGVLSIASATETESSLSDNYSIACHTWLSDRFSNNLVECMSQTPEMTYRELYTYLVSHTIGSHVKIFNAPQFGNLYRESPKEFFVAAVK
ncbi:MAG: C13 family peptidase [Bacteroides sp.]